jgi:cytochrome b subunit of formate dehydrogenase
VRIPRMNLHLRLQHGVLFLSVLLSLVTGIGSAYSLSAAFGISFETWLRAHRWAGSTAAVLVVYHVFYLFIRGYIEGQGWHSFPLAWKKSDGEELRGLSLYLLTGETKAPEAGLYRASQKVFYWGTAILVSAIVVPGLLITYWESLWGFALLPHLGLLAQFHRGFALLLLAFSLWHLYGAFTLEGSWKPQWTWLTGTITEETARSKVAGFYRDFQHQEEIRLTNRKKKSLEEAEEEARKTAKEHVELDLQEGNRLAKEEKFVDAIFHYRRALEQYPGYSQARYNMGVVLRKMGERSMAADEFRRFVQDDPFHPLAREAQKYIAELSGKAEE